MPAKRAARATTHGAGAQEELAADIDTSRLRYTRITWAALHGVTLILGTVLYQAEIGQHRPPKQLSH